MSIGAHAEAPRKVTIGLALNTNVRDYDTNAFTLFLEEQKNIDIEFVLFTNINEKLPVLVSSGSELPDMIIHNLNTATVWKWVQEGIFVKLDDYWANPERTRHLDSLLEFLHEDDIAAKKAELLANAVMPDGSIYTFT